MKLRASGLAFGIVLFLAAMPAAARISVFGNCGIHRGLVITTSPDGIARSVAVWPAETPSVAVQAQAEQGHEDMLDEEERHGPAVTPAISNHRRSDHREAGEPSSRLITLIRGLAEKPSAGMLGMALALAFVLGTLHAVQPGHGKTLVAAYLVGSRGRVSHAVLLGFVVMLTHTFSVYVIALFVLLGVERAADLTVILRLKLASGLGISIIGAWMLSRALRKKAMPEVRLGAGYHRHEHGNASDQPAPETEPASLGRLFALGITGG